MRTAGKAKQPSSGPRRGLPGSLLALLLVQTLVTGAPPQTVTVVIKHNLIIEPEADAPFDPARNHVYHLGAGPQRGVVAENNLVFKSLHNPPPP